MNTQNYLTELAPWLHLMVTSTCTAILSGADVDTSSLSVGNLSKRYVDFLASSVEASTGPFTEDTKSTLLQTYTTLIRFMVTGHTGVEGVTSIFWWRMAPLILSSVQMACDAVAPVGQISCVKYDPETGYTNTLRGTPIGLKVTHGNKPSMEGFPSLEQWKVKEENAIAFFTVSLNVKAKAEASALAVAKRDMEVVASAYQTLDDFAKIGIVLTHDNFVQTVDAFRALDAMGLLFI